MSTLPEAVLYQFALCPFCSKVREGLELKGIPYRVVEVNPRTKAELPVLPPDAPRKVPVLTVGDTTVYDSTSILRFLDQAYPDTLRFRPVASGPRERADELEEWVDAELIPALPTVLYGTWREASRAAAVIGKSSQFGLGQGLGVKLGGSVVMYLVAKRILKKAGRSDGHAWVSENLDKVESWLGGQAFVCGAELTIADVAIAGALRCVREFPIYKNIEARPRLRRWLTRIAASKVTAAAGARQRNDLTV
jgi:glutathione S-transferase